MQWSEAGSSTTGGPSLRISGCSRTPLRTAHEDPHRRWRDPLPTNPARGTFVADHARLLRTAGHEVRILNALPWMRPFQEARRSTLTGVARAPSHFRHEDVDVDVVRYLGFPEQTLPALTRLSVRRAARMSRRRLGIGRPTTSSPIPYGQWRWWLNILPVKQGSRGRSLFTDGMLMWGCITP